MQNRVLLQLAGVLAFGGILAFTHYAGGWISGYTRDTYNIIGGFVFSIPLHFLLVLGTLLLRLDVLRQAVLLRSIRISILLIYGWPFAVFVVILPLVSWIFPNELAVWVLMKHYYWFGSFAGQIESMLFGIGVIAALEPRRDT